MDKYSFLNAVHPAYIAELYDKYLQYPDSVEPSWRAFFQGFDFGIESDSLEALGIEKESGAIPQNSITSQILRTIKLRENQQVGAPMPLRNPA